MPSAHQKHPSSILAPAVERPQAPENDTGNSSRLSLNATTIAVLALVLSASDLKSVTDLPNLPQKDSWETLQHSHIMAILRLATRELFLPGDGLRVCRDRHQIHEDESFETDRWRELWLIGRLSPLSDQGFTAVMVAARQGEFNHLGHECRSDLINEIQKRHRLKRGSTVVTVEYDSNLHDIAALPGTSLSEYRPRDLGRLEPFVQACFAVAEHLGDVSDSLVAQEVARQLHISVDVARKYTLWARNLR